MRRSSSEGCSGSAYRAVRHHTKPRIRKQLPVRASIASGSPFARQAAGDRLGLRKLRFQPRARWSLRRMRCLQDPGQTHVLRKAMMPRNAKSIWGSRTRRNANHTTFLRASKRKAREVIAEGCSGSAYRAVRHHTKPRIRKQLPVRASIASGSPFARQASRRLQSCASKVVSASERMLLHCVCSERR